MSLSESTRTEIRNCLSILKVIAGVVLLAAISWEIIAGDHMHFSRNYLIIQLVVCILFLCDFFVRWAASERKARFFGRNFLVLLISIPYLNIIDWSSAELPRYWATLIGIMPLMRAFLAFYIVVQWLVDNKVRKLFFAYIFTVVVFTYISALVFYDYEILVNSKLHGFGNALWWAWMNVTTVGAEIFPVTTIGKIFCVMLPSLGMMFFPIFTTYVLQEYSHKKSPTNRPDSSFRGDIPYFFCAFSRSRISVSSCSSLDSSRPGGGAGASSFFFIRRFINFTIMKTQNARIVKSMHCWMKAP